MEVETYKPTRKALLRVQAFRQTAAGKASDERISKLWDSNIRERKRLGMPVPPESSEKEEAPR